MSQSTVQSVTSFILASRTRPSSFISLSPEKSNEYVYVHIRAINSLGAFILISVSLRVFRLYTVLKEHPPKHSNFFAACSFALFPSFLRSQCPLQLFLIKAAEGPWWGNLYKILMTGDWGGFRV